MSYLSAASSNEKSAVGCTRPAAVSRFSTVPPFHDAPQRRFSGLPNLKGGRSIAVADPITGRAPTEEAAMGQDVRSPRGPRCIALVGPFQSGKTTLLEAIMARTGAIPKAGSVESRNFRRRSNARGPPSQDGRRPHRRHDQLHGRQLHLHRLSRFDRIRARHARRASGGRRRGRGLRGRRAQAAAAADHPARAGGSRHSRVSCFSTRSTAPTSASARRSRPCSRRRGFRWCCARFRSGTAI